MVLELPLGVRHPDVGQGHAPRANDHADIGLRRGVHGGVVRRQGQKVQAKSAAEMVVLLMLMAMNGYDDEEDDENDDDEGNDGADDNDDVAITREMAMTMRIALAIPMRMATMVAWRCDDEAMRMNGERWA